MKRCAMAFSGPSNSGKTTLIAKLSLYMRDLGLKVAIIKHDPKDKACFDSQGKDSFIFFNTGANTLVLSPKRTTLFTHEQSSFKEAVSLLPDFDILLVEGLKTLPLPRILVFKDELYQDYFDSALAVASYKKTNKLFWIHLDDIESICKYIFKNAKAL